KLLPGLRRDKIGCRVALDVAVEQKKVEEAAHGALRPRDRARREALARERHHELRQALFVERLRPALLSFGPSLQTSEIPAVALDRVLRQPLLDAQEAQVLANHVTRHSVSVSTRRSVGHGQRRAE